MESRAYRGVLVIDGQATEPFGLKVCPAGDAAMATGTGSFAMPLALVGAREGSAVDFRTEEGATITLLLSEIDPAEGRAYFLTLDTLPAAGRARRAG